MSDSATTTDHKIIKKWAEERDGRPATVRATEEDGMPKGNLGRIGLAVAPSNPSIVYALVEAEKSALLRSDANRHAAAKLLGIDIATLEKKLAEHGLDGRA